MIHALLLLLLALPAAAQSTAPARSLIEDARIDAMDISIRELQSGRPTLTGTPTLQGGFTATGVATFNSSVTINGLTTLASTMTVGSLSYTHNVTTANYSAVLKGSFSQVAAASATTQTNVYFYGWQSSFTTKIDLTYCQVTSNGILNLVINDDAGSNYVPVGHLMDSSGNNALYNPGASAACPITQARSVLAGDCASFEIQLRRGASPGKTNQVRITALPNFRDGAASSQSFTPVSCEYSGAAEPNRFRLTTSAGTMTGFFDLYTQVPVVRHQ